MNRDWGEWWTQMGWSQPGFFPYFDQYEDEEFTEEQAEEIIEGPLLPLRDMVFFPRMVAPLVVARPLSIEAVEVALELDEPLIAVAQRDAQTEEAGPEDLYNFGTDIVIGRMLRMPDALSASWPRAISGCRFWNTSIWSRISASGRCPSWSQQSAPR